MKIKELNIKAIDHIKLKFGHIKKEKKTVVRPTKP